MAGWEQTGLERDVSRRVGAVITRVAWAKSREALLAALPLPEGTELVASLGGLPIACPDMRVLAEEARAAGRVLVVDNTLVTSFGSSPARRGGHLVVEHLQGDREEGRQAWALSLSRDARTVPGLREAAAALPRIEEETQEAIRAGLTAREESRQLANDQAAVVASYLACHPRVAEVRYPGLADDPSHEAAAALLHHGFGPIVDFLLAEGAPTPQPVPGLCLALHGSWWRVTVGQPSPTDPLATVRLLEAALQGG